MKIIKIGLNGAYGQMGKAIDLSINNENNKKNFQLIAKLGSSSGQMQIDEACSLCDVMIDFSSASSIEMLYKSAYKYGTKLLVGTTGLKPEHMEHLRCLAAKTAVIYAPNTGIGANLIASFASRAATILRNYDAEIVEAHHRYKKDVPSGTAIMIGKKIAEAREIDFDKHAVFDRSNSEGRRHDEIGFSSIRAGGIFGENEVIFAEDNEMISIGCRAFSRNAFAEGALKGAAWLVGKEPGLYSMQDVLGL